MLVCAVYPERVVDKCVLFDVPSEYYKYNPNYCRPLDFVSGFTDSLAFFGVMSSGSCRLQVKTESTDGYTALQLGAGERKWKNVPKAQAERFLQAGVNPKRKVRSGSPFSLDAGGGGSW